MYEGIVQDLIDELGRLPGVGPKSAQRIAFHLLQADPVDVRRLADVLVEVKAQGEVLHASASTSSEDEQCRICRDPRRDPAVLCVVEEYKDVVAIERTREFRGRYHVLGGAISPIDGIGPDQLRIKELLHRLADGAVTEVILATDPNLEGEATATYLTRMLKDFGLRVTRLASGLPVGGDLEYADEVTLGRAFAGRRSADDWRGPMTDTTDNPPRPRGRSPSRSPTRSESFLLALRAIAREPDGGRAISLLLLEISQILLAGARLGRPAGLHAPHRSTSPTSARTPTSTSCGCGWPSCSATSTPTASSSTPTLPEVVDSQLSDDLTSIATDLENGLRHYRTGNVAEALWWWQFSYVSSWGNLAGAALSALLSVVAHDRLDAEIASEQDQIEAAEAVLDVDRVAHLSAGRLRAVRHPSAGVSSWWALSCRSTAAPPSPTPRASSGWPGGSSRASAGRPRRRRGRLGDGRHHRRAARPRQRGEPAAARP